jgi:hypothetical protein
MAPSQPVSHDSISAASKRLQPLKETWRTNVQTKSAGAHITILPQQRATVGDAPVVCWAHTRAGVRCSTVVETRQGEPIPIPYCARHLGFGDGALKVVKHPFAGHCLVARYDLPRGYRLAFHGNRGKCATSDKEDRSLSFYPPNPVTGSNFYSHRNESGVGPVRKRRKINNYNGVVNPRSTGDLMQYASCPGPSERQNLKSTFQYFGIRNGAYGGLEFVTAEVVPRHAQLCLWYGPGWWHARGIKRRDVGTPNYPAPKKLCRKKMFEHNSK